MGVLGVVLGVLSLLGVVLEGSPALLPWDSTFCHLARPIPGSPLGSLSFLGKDAQRLALFHAHWDAHGRLQACSRRDEPELTAAFRALCAGVLHGLDLCCREHDHCPQNISPFQYNYGIRNYRFHTISHCDCDARFQQCLQNQQDSISDIVGMAFFNVLEIPCFVLEEQEACVAWHWWGGCRMYGSIPFARLQPKTLYNASWSSPTTTRTPSPQSPAPSKLRQKQHPRKWPPQRKASQHPNKANATALWAPGASLGSDMAPTAQLEVTHPGLQGIRQACHSFRHLDQCEHQIGPQKTKFQLLNSASVPLFHCNCTRPTGTLPEAPQPACGQQHALGATRHVLLQVGSSIGLC